MFLIQRDWLMEWHTIYLMFKKLPNFPPFKNLSQAIKQSILEFWNQCEFIRIPDSFPVVSIHFYNDISTSSNI